MTKLYLFPNLLVEELEDHTPHLPKAIDAAVPTIDALIAESEKPARKFLKRFTFEAPKTFRDVPIYLLNEHTTPQEKDELFKKMQGKTFGLISDCGLPCLADPGADLVLKARRAGVHIETFAGPSSILFTLLLSGLGGQQFAFNGYLPREDAPLEQKLKALEKRSRDEKSTQLFIETPYRNQKIFEKILNTLDPNTWLCIACDLTAPTQFVQTLQLKEWKKRETPFAEKRPCVFAFFSP